MSRNNTLAAALAASALLALSATVPAFSSETDREQVKANFQLADVDNDLKLNSSEFKTFIDLNANHSIGRTATIRRFGAYGTAFGKVDVNGDGFATKEEVLETAANR